MRRTLGNVVVIALGGSIIFPGEIDVRFIARFNAFIRKFIRKRRKFVIVVGGGRLSRLFQTAAKRVSNITDEDKDWIGIHATRLNAHLLRTVLRDVADPVVVDARHKMKKLRYPITFASGWRPGWSTDYVAMALACDFGAREAVIAGKPDYVYNKDYAAHKNARPFQRLGWREYRALIPAKWIPGSHAPIDPIATRFGEKHGIAAVVVGGRDLKNFRNLLNGKEFQGTIVE